VVFVGGHPSKYWPKHKRVQLKTHFERNIAVRLQNHFTFAVLCSHAQIFFRMRMLSGLISGFLKNASVTLCVLFQPRDAGFYPGIPAPGHVIQYQPVHPQVCVV
jgi:hypothetical protein